MKTLPMPRLSKVLEYENENVIKRYVKDFHSNTPFAKKIFYELLKFFWLSHLGKTIGVKNSMYRIIRPMDNMWHTFLLYTKDYHAFSEKYFGSYIHHNPVTEKIPQRSREGEFLRFIELAFDRLGIETLNFWYDTKITPKSSMSPAEFKNYACQKIYNRYFKSNTKKTARAITNEDNK